MGDTAAVPGNVRVDVLDAVDNTTLTSCSTWEYAVAWACSFPETPTAAGDYFLVLAPLSDALPSGPASQFEASLQVPPLLSVVLAFVCRCTCHLVGDLAYA